MGGTKHNQCQVIQATTPHATRVVSVTTFVLLLKLLCHLAIWLSNGVLSTLAQLPGFFTSASEDSSQSTSNTSSIASRQGLTVHDLLHAQVASGKTVLLSLSAVLCLETLDMASVLV